MKKLFIIVLIVTLIFLASCEKQKLDQDSKEIKQLYEEAKTVTEEKTEIKEVQNELKEENVLFEETPVNKCALLNKEEGNTLCEMPMQASEYKEYEPHNVCNQVFRSKKLPYPLITIKTLIYKSNAEAKKKFLIDLGALKGELKSGYLFERAEPTRVAELFKGKKIVRISDLQSKCKNFNKLVKLAFARA